MAGVLAALLASGPAASAASPPKEPISWTHFAVPPSPPVNAALIAHGKDVYRQNCAACHGAKGTADGRCAAFLIPHPRNFTTGIFRFKTTPGAAMPTDEDLFRTVSLGLHGTGMPPWRFLLSDRDRWAVVHYIKTFAPAFADQSKAGTPVDLSGEPRAVTKANIERGRKLFADAECAKCHGDQGYGDGPSADTLKDAFGNPIQPRNFHKAATFKRGHTLRDIALTIETGNNGTPMPAYGDAFDRQQLWDLAAFIQSLAERKLAGGGAPAAAHAGQHLGKPDVVIHLVERSWKFVPDEIRVRQGQIVKVELQPTDNGLGAGHGFAIDGYDKSTFINGAMVQRPKSVTFVADKPGTFTFYCATQCSTGSLHPNMKGTLVVEPVEQ